MTGREKILQAFQPGGTPETGVVAQVEEGPPALAHRFLRVVAQFIHHGIQNAGGHVLVDSGEQGFLVAEVVVDRAYGEPAVGADVLQGSVGIAPLSKELAGALQHRLAGLLTALGLGSSGFAGFGFGHDSVSQKM